MTYAYPRFKNHDEAVAKIRRLDSEKSIHVAVSGDWAWISMGLGRELEMDPIAFRSDGDGPTLFYLGHA